MRVFINRDTGVAHRDSRCGYLERSNLCDTERWQVDDTSPLTVYEGVPGFLNQPLDTRCQQCFSPFWQLSGAA